MRTRIPRNITGAALAASMILSSVMPAFADYTPGNTINSQDTTPGGDSSGNNSYNTKLI